MSKGCEIGLILVVTKGYRLLFHKTYKLFNIPIIQLEGLAFPLIAFKYPSDKYQQLEEFLQKVGITPLKKSDPASKKYQLLIDQLLDGSLLTKLGGVTTNPTGYGAFAHLKPIKQRTKVEQGIMWVTCPKDNQAHRISLCLNCDDPKHSTCKEQIKKYMEA